MSNISRACTGRAQSARIARCRARADTLAPWLWPTRQHLAMHSPPHSITPSHPSTLQHRHQGIFGGTPASAARLCHGRRRQSHLRSPARPWSSAHSSTSSCRHPQPRHVALQATERRFAGELIRPPRNRPRRAIKGGPRASPSTQEALECTPMALPCLAFDPGRSPSSSPATAAVATAPANSAPPGPPTLRSLHQEHPHPPVNHSHYSILIEDHRSPKTTLLPKLSVRREAHRRN